MFHRSSLKLRDHVDKIEYFVAAPISISDSPVRIDTLLKIGPEEATIDLADFWEARGEMF